MANRKWKNLTKEYINGKKLPAKSYNIWNAMMHRCKEGGKLQQKYPTYVGCGVCDEWNNYDVFFDWYKEHYREGYQLDKDILVKGNKIYSPETCSFVPQEINKLFVKRNKYRGELPLGVYFNKQANKYLALCNDNNGIKNYLGCFNTPLEAFQAYKTYKESVIRQTAENYFSKGLIEKRLFDAMMNYEVEITD